MPIFEFKCNDCDHNFEELIRTDASARCPECGSENTEKLISLCVRNRRSGGSGDYTPSYSGGGCGGCSGGNCASCGH